jgi:hypothetical protein
VVRGIIKRAQWTRSTAEMYRDAPHQYIVKFRPEGFTKRDWNRLCQFIRNCGERRTWRGQSYVYLIVDGFAYWSMWPIINRAKTSTLDR